MVNRPDIKGLLTVKLDTVESQCNKTATTQTQTMRLVCLHPKARIRFFYHKQPKALNPEKTDMIFMAWDGAKKNQGTQMIPYAYPGCCNGVSKITFLHNNGELLRK